MTAAALAALRRALLDGKVLLLRDQNIGAASGVSTGDMFALKSPRSQPRRLTVHVPYRFVPGTRTVRPHHDLGSF